MSFRPPRIRRSKSTQSLPPGSPQASPSTPHLFPLRTAPRVRRERDTAHLGLPVLQPILALPGGNDFTHSISTCHARSCHPPAPSNDTDDVFMDAPLDIFESDRPGPSAQHKKERQRMTWMEKVIPALVQPYLTLLYTLQASSSFDQMVQRAACTCNGPHSQLRVLCVYFQRKCSINVSAPPRVTDPLS
jgi:hypothetical protein